MSEPYIGEIRLFGFNFPPRGWAFCNGQLLPIPQNTALFSLLGTTYGGNGITTFALPNLQGRVAVGSGNGPGLTPRQLGEAGGSKQVTLSLPMLPGHTHSLMVSNELGEDRSPPGKMLARSVGGSLFAAPPADSTALVKMAPAAVLFEGGGQPHNNLMPYQAVNYCIALQGIYPAFS